MARAADTGGGGLPFVKFNEAGHTLVGAFASAPRECKRQRYKYDAATGTRSSELLTKPDGKPAFEEVMYFVAMPGTTAVLGNNENGFEAIEEFAHVRYSVSGFRWGQVIDARRSLEAFAGFKAGQPCSGDIYTITLIGWSAETKNPAAAAKAGFNVHEGRILLRTQEEKDAYVLKQSRDGGNTNPAKDFTVTIERPGDDDKAYEQAADALFDSKPWVNTGAHVDTPDDEPDPDEPF